jgi:hypothetical protein
MKQVMRVAAAIAALAAITAPATAGAEDPERPSKLAYAQGTLAPAQSLQDRFSSDGRAVQLYYRCKHGVTGKVAIFGGSDNAPAKGATMRCDDKVHWVKSVPVIPGRSYTVRLRVESPGFAGYSVWGFR